MSGLVLSGLGRDRTAPRARRRGDLLSQCSLGVLAVLVVATLLGRVFGAGGSPTRIVAPRLSPPDADHLLGTDSLGRSLLPRLLEGIGTTLLLSAVAVVVTALLGTALGLVAGYRGGWLGGLVLRAGDVLYAFPAIILAILVAAVVGPGDVATVASIVLVTLPLMTRMVGGATRSVARREFVTAAVISRVPTYRILLRHVLPNITGTLAVQGTYALSVGVLVEGGLSFLGYGVQVPSSSLGLLIQEGSNYLVQAPWLLLAPGVVLVLAILSANLLGDALRDRLEPRETRSLS